MLPLKTLFRLIPCFPSDDLKLPVQYQVNMRWVFKLLNDILLIVKYFFFEHREHTPHEGVRQAFHERHEVKKVDLGINFSQFNLVKDSLEVFSVKLGDVASGLAFNCDKSQAIP